MPINNDILGIYKSVFITAFDIVSLAKAGSFSILTIFGLYVISVMQSL